jgi:hypothetical protein
MLRVPASELRAWLAVDPANFTAIARQAASSRVPHSGHRYSPGEERGFGTGDRVYQKPAVEVVVAAFAGGLCGE